MAKRKRADDTEFYSDNIDRSDPKAVKRLKKQITVIRALITKAKKAEFAVWRVLYETEIDQTWQIAGYANYRTFAEVEFGLRLDGKYRDYCAARKHLDHDDLVVIGVTAVRRFMLYVYANAGIKRKAVRKFYCAVRTYCETDQRPGAAQQTRHVNSAASDLGLAEPGGEGPSWKARAEEMATTLRVILRQTAARSKHKIIAETARMGLEAAGYAVSKKTK